MDRAKNLTMKWTSLLLVLWMTTFSGDAASNSLASSVEEDGRERACPGEVVRYTCTVVDTSNPVSGSTLWRGSAFDCPPDDEITLQHSRFGAGNSGVCGALTAQSEGQDGTCFTSVLTLPEADEGMSGKTIECTLGGAITAGSDTVYVAFCPAPNITITEVTPMSVSVSIDGYPEDTLRCSYILMGNVTDESGQTVRTFTTTNETSVIVDGLNLCTNVYTFEVSVMCGNAVSNITTMEFSANLTSLDPVTNVRNDDNTVTLLWDAPANAPDNCIVNYTIEVEVKVDGVPIRNSTTPDNSTSYSLVDLPLCVVCITIVPVTVRIGVVETSRSDPIQIPPMQALPPPTINVTELTPESVRVSVIDYPEQSLQCITNFTVEETSGTGQMAFSESGLSVDISLDLCADVYTFQGNVISNNVSSVISAEVELNANLATLDSVTDVRSEGKPLTLLWDAPTNTPDNCIVNYQIEVDGFPMFNTSNSTSIPVSSLSLTACDEHNVTVAPITVRISVVETSRSDPHRLIALAPVTNVRSEDNFVTLEWDAPTNVPDNCIVNYQIRVELEGMTAMTNDDSTSYNIAELNLSPREEHNVTVAPITVSFGLVETSRSDPFTIPQEPAASESDDSVIIIIIVVILVIVGTTIVVNLNLILIDIYRPGEEEPSKEELSKEEPSKEPPCKIWVTIILVSMIVPIPFVIYLYCCRYKKRDEKPSKERPCEIWVTIILVVVVVVTIPFVIYLYCCRDKKQDTETPYKSEKLMELKSQVTRPDEDAEVTTDTCVAYGVFTGRARAPPPEATYEVVADPNPAYHTVLQAGGTGSQEHA